MQVARAAFLNKVVNHINY